MPLTKRPASGKRVGHTRKMKTAVLLCLALAGASFDCRATAESVSPRPSVAASGLAATQELAKRPPAEDKAAATAPPRFEDYPSTVAFSGRPAPVVVASARYGRTYRTR